MFIHFGQFVVRSLESSSTHKIIKNSTAASIERLPFSKKDLDKIMEERAIRGLQL